MDLQMIKLIRSAFGLLCYGSLIFAVACSSSTSASYSQPAAQSDPPSSQLSSVSHETPAASLDQAVDSNTNTLENLWKVRMVDRAADLSRAGFTLGPGDLSASRATNPPTKGSYVSRVRTGHDLCAIARPNQRHWHDPARSPQRSV